jgi:hypothetical protein
MPVIILFDMGDVNDKGQSLALLCLNLPRFYRHLHQGSIMTSEVIMAETRRHQQPEVLL